MSRDLPGLLVVDKHSTFPVLVRHEEAILREARQLFDAGFYGHSLLNIWNASIHLLRRRAEAYGVDLFESVAKDESGRKNYKKNGETLAERWSGVDDLVLISSSAKLGTLNKKAAKSLEMINWMRNHASPAHDSEQRIEQEDVIALVLILQKNLFEAQMPDPGHSISGLFDPIKQTALASDELELLRDQIRVLRVPDIRITFGFMLDLLCKGENPALHNVEDLFPTLWDRSNDDLRKTAGLRYHSLTVDRGSDDSPDRSARSRLLDMLTKVSGIQYIPDAARASIYRQAARNLAKAKDTSYGWSDEVTAARTLAQFGPHVPAIAFEEVYQEILSVWCGNYWGRSKAHSILTVFFQDLNTDQLRKVAHMFISNERVRGELFQKNPTAVEKLFLNQLKDRVTIEAHKAEIDEAITSVEAM